MRRGNHRRQAALVLAAGAAAIAVARALLGVPFDAVPLLVGLVALVAAAVQREPRPWTVGMVLVALGLAVLFVPPGPRASGLYLVAGGIGLLVSLAAGPASGAQATLRSGGLTLVGAGLVLVLATDLPVVTTWWAVPAALGLIAAVEGTRLPG